MLVHGSVVERRGGLPARVVDRHGRVALAAEWKERRLLRAAVTLPYGGSLELEAGATTHPLFGCADAVKVEGATIARFQAVEWAAPRAVPPLDRPAALPPGGGSAVLNWLALCAGDRPLRYSGPYPTAALFDSLLDSFRVAGDPQEALGRFVRGVEESAALGRTCEPDVEFRPAPHERIWCRHGVCVQLRDGVEKVWIRGRAYAREAGSARRLRRIRGGWVAALEIGGESWSEVARLDQRGELVAGPEPVAPVEGPLVGRPLPAKVSELLAALLPERAPALLGGELGRLLREVDLVWGDPGEAAARRDADHIVVHAGLAERLEAEPLLLALVDAIEPVARRWAQERLEASFP